MDFIGGLPPERIMNMKILMQNLSEVTDFNSGRIQILLTPYDDAQIKAAIVYGGFVSNSFKVSKVCSRRKSVYHAGGVTSER